MRQYKYISTGFLSILTLGFLLYLPPDSGGTPHRVWLVNGERIIEYDPSTWTVVRSIEIPKHASQNPERLQITPSGTMVFCPDPYTTSGAMNKNSESGKAWIYDGQVSSLLDLRSVRETIPAVECRESIRESYPQIAISRDGKKLFWFANEFERVREVDGPDISVSTTVRIWQTDLSGSNTVNLADFKFPPCSCGTGVCMETCPEGEFWFPDDGIDDFFVIHHFIQGQLGSTSSDSFIYRKLGDTWSSARFDPTYDTILDAHADGDTILYAIRDSGCCGWDNDSSDQTLLSSEGTMRSIFDERERFSNPDYDVSFYTSKAMLSPDGVHIAVHIATTQRESDAIRLSSTGEENPNELARIREAMEIMPLVEVIPASGSDTPLVSIPDASLAGWLNEQAILIVQNGILIQCDISTSECRNTPVAVKKDAAVFIR